MNEIQERMKGLLESGSHLLDREDVCRMTLLALAAEESVFLYGPPGTAKSMAAKWAASILDTDKYFSCLLNQYTQPDELFGPVSIKSLENGTRETLTQGYMPEAEIAFLDEIWKAGPAILNTLLTICNEKTFRNGNRTEEVPLKLLLSASNEFPSEDSGLEPLYDRFLIRMCVGPIGRKDSFVSMITGKKDPQAVTKAEPVTKEELEGWRRGSEEVEVPKEITDFLYSMRLRLNERDIYVSDRRWKKIVNLLRTSAHLNGRKKVGYSDLFVLENTLWTRPEDKAAVKECASESVTAATVKGSFPFVERIANEIKAMEAETPEDAESYSALLKKLDGERTYLDTLKGELEMARIGGENFWKNVFSGLSTEFALELMNRGIERLREFITEAEDEIDGIRLSKQPDLTNSLSKARATVILEKDEEPPSPRVADEPEGEADGAERPAETMERKVMSIKEMQDERFRLIEDTLSIGIADAEDRTDAEDMNDDGQDTEQPDAAAAGNGAEERAKAAADADADTENGGIGGDATAGGGTGETEGNGEETVDEPAAGNAEEDGAGDRPREQPEAEEPEERSPQDRRAAEAERKEAEKERIKEQIQQAIRRNQVEEQSRNIIQNGISRIIKAFTPEKVAAAEEREAESIETLKMEQMMERTAQVRQELNEMSAGTADGIESAADEGERTEYETKLSNTKTFQEFVEMSHYKYTGDSSDKRYKWNGNLNNGAKWWNVGSRFYQMLDGDRNTLSAIEAECAKRGAKIGGKYHWVFSVCYIFEKNDGIYDWKTRAELKWLLGGAWHFLEPVFNEALL